MLNNACGGGAGGVNVGLLPTLEGETPLTTFHFLAGPIQCEEVFHSCCHHREMRNFGRPSAERRGKLTLCYDYGRGN